MTPEHERRCLRALIEYLPVLPPFKHDPEALDMVHRRLAEMERGLRAPIVFHRVDKDLWRIGRDESAASLYRCSLVGLRAAWRAIRASGKPDIVRSDEFAKPAARQPDTSVREAIHRTASAWLQRHTGCAELVSALHCISVARGVVVYVPSSHAPVIDTGPHMLIPPRWEI